MRPVDWYGANVVAWNPLAMRCERLGTGCTNCWHLRMADRLSVNPKLPQARRKAWAGQGETVATDDYDAPLRRRKPTIIATQFMGDLFYYGVSAAVIEDVWRIMCAATWHTFLVLTKRAERLLSLCQEQRLSPPSAHMFIGVSAATQAEFDTVAGPLVKIPAQHRWLSLEPLLGRINLDVVLRSDHGGASRPFVDWVVVGAETGPSIRVMETVWASDICDQCQAARVPCYVKQVNAVGERLLNGRLWDEVPWS